MLKKILLCSAITIVLFCSEQDSKTVTTREKLIAATNPQSLKPLSIAKNSILSKYLPSALQEIVFAYVGLLFVEDTDNKIKEFITHVAPSPNGKYLAVLKHDNKVYIYDLKNNNYCSEIIENPNSSVTSVAYLPNGQYIATHDAHKKIKIWDSTTYTLCTEITYPNGQQNSTISSLVISPNSKYIACSRIDGGSSEFNIIKIATKEHCSKKFNGVTAFTYTSDDNLIIATTAGWGESCKYVLQFWNINPEIPPVERYAMHRDQDTLRATLILDVSKPAPIGGLACSPNGAYLATCSNNTIEIYDNTKLPKSLPLISTITRHSSPFCRIAFSADSTRLYCPNGPAGLRSWILVQKLELKDDH